MGGCKPELIHQYADGELSPAHAGRLEEHLGHCPRCRGLLAELLTVKQSLAGLIEVIPPARLRSQAAQAAAAACPQVRSFMGDYLDGELAAARKESLALHFALCRPCREELLVQRQLQAVVSTLPPTASPALWIRARVREKLAAGRLRFRPLLFPAWRSATARSLGLATALAGAVLALLWLVPPLQQPTISTEEAALPKLHEPAPVVRQPLPSAPAPRVEIAPAAETTPAVAVASPPSASNRVVRGRLAAWRRPLTSRAVPLRLVEQEEVDFAALFEAEHRSVDWGVEAEGLWAEEPAVEPEVASEPAPVIAAAAPAELPSDVVEMRRELLQASERYQVLSMENSLSSVPQERVTPAGGPESPRPPLPDVSTPRNGSWA